MERNNEYWATKPTEEIAEAILEHFSTYQSWGTSTGYFNRIKRCYDAYYSVNEKGTLALEKSDDGRITHIDIAHYKNLIKRLHILITQNKLAFEARAINSDSESQLDADLAKGLLEFYESECHMGRTLSHAVETALVCLEAHTWSPWDSQKGQEVATDGSALIFEGDQSFEVLTALNVARSTSLPESPWKILRVKRHKYNLAAQYPDHQDAILNATTSMGIEDYCLDPTVSGRQSENQEDEAVFVYVMYHEKNHALPEGREVWICGDAVLEDKKLEYEEMPVFQLKAGSVIDSTWADSPGVSLISLQEAINLLSSATLSNNLDNAKQNIYSQDPNITVRKLNASQNLITATQPPQGINFTNSSPETYKLIDSLVQQQGILSGVNEASRGGGASSASGSSLALQMATAVQFVSDLQANYAVLASDIGSCVIDNLKAFSKTERLAYISGVRKKSYARRFKAEDLYNVDRIIVSLSNAMTQSLAGRWELMQQFMQYQVITDPSVLANFLRTGEIESATEDQFQDSILIRDENEAMLKGEIPPVVMTDNHPGHILKHKEMFSDQEVRGNPQLMQNILTHIEQHIQAHKNIDPDLAAILNIPPLPSQQQPPAPPTGELEPMPGQPEGVNVNVPDGTPEGTAEIANQITENIGN